MHKSKYQSLKKAYRLLKGGNPPSPPLPLEPLVPGRRSTLQPLPSQRFTSRESPKHSHSMGNLSSTRDPPQESIRETQNDKKDCYHDFFDKVTKLYEETKNECMENRESAPHSSPKLSSVYYPEHTFDDSGSGIDDFRGESWGENTPRPVNIDDDDDNADVDPLMMTTTM